MAMTPEERRARKAARQKAWLDSLTPEQLEARRQRKNARQRVRNRERWADDPVYRENARERARNTHRSRAKDMTEEQAAAARKRNREYKQKNPEKQRQYRRKNYLKHGARYNAMKRALRTQKGPSKGFLESALPSNERELLIKLTGMVKPDTYNRDDIISEAAILVLYENFELSSAIRQARTIVNKGAWQLYNAKPLEDCHHI